MKLTPAQVHWFRLCRSGLVEPFATLEETARRLVGVQAQLPPAAALAFCNRTAGCTAADVEGARLERRSLVRFWGQRNTVHMYAADDWPFLHAAFAERQSIMRRKLDRAGLTGDFHRLVRRIEKRLEAGEHLTYRDVKARKLQEQQDRWVVSYVAFMQLVRRGVTCHGPGRGTESGFVHREHWVPQLPWNPPSREEAYPELAARYLSAYGPAGARDLAFCYGTTLTNARRWIEAAGERLRRVCVGDRSYWCRAADLEELGTKPPSAARWPVRLLYRFDPLLLATKEKDWLVDDEHYKKVWRPSAHVEPVLLLRGRIAGTWRYDRAARGLVVRIRPFERLTSTADRAVEREARAIARFLDLPLAGLEQRGVT